ncbi:BEL1-like homeodomain protein 1 [Zingiber officinale]|uniref:Homeobox domain-containing protein n=1 Tax=Zingiber officinale TaxID=94328 RepID=A0A8J5CBL7_ZINOF|nr:BEL1-like homeodomain protein 1 [Zingiber officinale]KAG6471912.1 hypothetical protein ZIOFF_069365 [Zingiber officinale]
MPAYFHDEPELQAVDGLQTLYVMNSSTLTGYDDAPAAAPSNILLNTTMSNSGNLIDQQRQHFVGVSPQPEPGLLHNLWSEPFPSDTARQETLFLSLSRNEVAAAPVVMARAIAEQEKSSASFLMGSKYLKAAQLLLDELVNVSDGIKDTKIGKGTSSRNPAVYGRDDVAAVATNLTVVERQELQMKKDKLVDMLEEVEQRHKQYHHRMQAVVSSFEAIAGYGSTRAYTLLAFLTISKQFRCLRDAIASQIRTSSRRLGEEDGKVGGSRLRFIDQHFRLQRTLQQMGIMTQNSWRPQRGLPESSVSILRAWLFDHFLHPYPKDSDKIVLAKQTGLTRSQVSNWFINARVRLWKPMVEEMYMEEIKEHEQIKNKENDPSKSTDANRSSTSKPSDAIEESTSTKKAKNSNSLLGSIKAMPEETSNQELLMRFIAGGATGHGGGNYGAYPIREVGGIDAEQLASRFSGNGISLTLGLQHSENLSLANAQTSLLHSERIWEGGWR